ncbi:MAG: hypothetical protein M3373_03975 [Gemmatimonadota bacterium]|nr:hypothetical protein [Gemmatimonadota bacterium]
MQQRSRPFAALLVAVAALAGCAPKAPPLTGVPAPVRLPRTELSAGYTTLTFRWTYADPDVRLHGNGVARIAAPDSVRLDFFLSGGMGSGHALLIGDELRVPGIGMLERFLPPPPLLWAALGRLRIPAAADTVVRVDADTLRAEIGQDPRWRAAFVGAEIRRVDRISGDRLDQWVTRDGGGAIRYERPTARRVLEITVLRSEPASAFDAAIWR